MQFEAAFNPSCASRPNSDPSPAPSGVCLSPTLAHAELPFIEPLPESLSCSFTLPAASHSPGIVRAATRAILRVHGLAEVTDAVVQVASELTACACRFSPSAQVYVSLRYREGAVRVTLYDDHPRHANTRLEAACQTHRGVTLRVLDQVVRACDGDWGIGGGLDQDMGTRMWALLPWEGARAYGSAPGPADCQ
ncbi:ATP-binding protein [Streptomyces neyagawaensis]|uniref:ATP-binding protein n=1 Tax=Streptomyces neyagawaensis TaxID=42238 RepID=UPI000ADF4109|nr:ATP-binding protein [Streptomyces neyagawaensis]MCL6736707.1 ATP-binding protein [Streptomyces neyagawaensis]MDE1684388.1 ATP-binding protein [Streptomyces neyagawaensis]